MDRVFAHVYVLQFPACLAVRQKGRTAVCGNKQSGQLSRTSAPPLGSVNMSCVFLWQLTCICAPCSEWQCSYSSGRGLFTLSVWNRLSFSALPPPTFCPTCVVGCASVCLCMCVLSFVHFRLVFNISLLALKYMKETVPEDFLSIFVLEMRETRLIIFLQTSAQQIVMVQ